jgi:hypothetical protein
MEMAFAPGSFEEFVATLSWRVQDVADESGLPTIRIPIGICIVLSSNHGGNAIAEELIRRFHLLNLESGSYIDFYFPGWYESSRESEQLEFSLSEFVETKSELRKAGVTRFSGNADLLLVDAERTTEGDTVLHFDSAVRLDLPRLLDTDGHITLGSVLETLMDTAREAPKDNPTWSISDGLGILYGKEAIVGKVWDKLGSLIGADRLAHFAVRSVGRPFTLPR